MKKIISVLRPAQSVPDSTPIHPAIEILDRVILPLIQGRTKKDFQAKLSDQSLGMALSLIPQLHLFSDPELRSQVIETLRQPALTSGDLACFYLYIRYTFDTMGSRTMVEIDRCLPLLNENGL
jgi:hypothetical protein